MTKLFFYVIVLLLVFTSCSSVSANVDIDDMIGQMLMFGFRGDSINDEWIKTYSSQIVDLNIGGILVLSYNIKSPTQLDSLMTHFNDLNSKYMLLKAIDQEGGRVQRLHPNKGFIGFPSAEEVANTMTPDQAYLMYSDLVQECKLYGFNYILAPVVDVNINPVSPAIGNIERSYSKNPEIVTLYATAFIRAVKDNNLISSLKHFPGHGSAENDSHQGFTDVTNTWQFLELDPYISLINSNTVQSIMSAHIYHADIDSIYPASLSEKHINYLLRNELNFSGVVISDDLQMGAIQQHYTLEETVIQAIKSGSDILIFSQYFSPDINLPNVVVNIIKNAIKDGLITKERIITSYERIAKLKSQIK